MSVEKRKERAQRLFTSGRYAPAAELYLALCMERPQDAGLRLKHAESARRAGQTLAAVSSYRNAARLLTDSGHEARARSSLRMALELAPGHPEVKRALAALEPARASSIDQAINDALASANDPADSISIEEGELESVHAIDVGEPEPLVTDVLELPLPTEVPAVSTAREFHRLDDRTIAFRKPDGTGWFVVHSETSLTMSEIDLEEELEILETVDVNAS